MKSTCEDCGATTEIDGAFVTRRELFESAASTLCPNCRKERFARRERRLLALNLAFGAIGLLLIRFEPEDPLGWFLVNTLIFLIFTWLSVWPHEFGHATAASILGWKVHSIQINRGRRLTRKRILGFRTDFNAFPFGGFVFCSPITLEWFKAKYTAIVLAGPLSNLAVCALAVLVSRAAGDSLIAGFGRYADGLIPIQMLFLANILFFVMNLAPVTRLGPAGQEIWDGARLLRIPKMKSAEVAAAHALLYARESQEALNRIDAAVAGAWSEKGLAAYPDNPWLESLKLIVWLEHGRFAEAREGFLRLLQGFQSDPVNRALMENNVAYANALLDDPDLLDEADRLSASAMQNLGWMPEIRGTRGIVLLWLGRTNEAIELLRSAFDSPEQSASNKALNACFLAIAESRRGNLSDGLRYLEQARKRNSGCFMLSRAELIVNRIGAIEP